LRREDSTRGDSMEADLAATVDADETGSTAIA
jgi:hypothetical protein